MRMKNRIIGIVVVLVLVAGGVVFLILSSNEGKKSEGENFTTGEGQMEEIFSLSGRVFSVDAENNFLMVKPSGKENEIKVSIGDNTKLIRLESPLSSKNPPKPGTQFTPKQTEITLKDFKEGDEIFIKTLKNIAGKTEFDDVEFIQILP